MKIESLNIYFHGIMAWVFPYVKAGNKILQNWERIAILDN